MRPLLVTVKHEHIYSSWQIINPKPPDTYISLVSLCPPPLSCLRGTRSLPSRPFMLTPFPRVPQLVDQSIAYIYMFQSQEGKQTEKSGFIIFVVIRGHTENNATPSTKYNYQIQQIGASSCPVTNSCVGSKSCSCLPIHIKCARFLK